MSGLTIAQFVCLGVVWVSYGLNQMVYRSEMEWGDKHRIATLNLRISGLTMVAMFALLALQLVALIR